MNNQPTSGEWVGYYTYQGNPKKCGMHLTLHFAGNEIKGAGIDGPGQFVIRGNYDEAQSRVSFSKAYVGKHTVQYEAQWQADEILGTWSLQQGERLMQGHMRMWPLPEGLYGDNEALQLILEKEIRRKS